MASRRTQKYSPSLEVLNSYVQSYITDNFHSLSSLGDGACSPFLLAILLFTSRCITIVKTIYGLLLSYRFYPTTQVCHILSPYIIFL